VLYVPVIDDVITLRLALAILIPYLYRVHLVGLPHLVRNTLYHVLHTSHLYQRRHIVWPISNFLSTKYECINESIIVWSSLSGNLLVSFLKLLNRFREKLILITGYGKRSHPMAGFGMTFREHLDFAASVLPVGLL
jgi:hypothetical protein